MRKNIFIAVLIGVFIVLFLTIAFALQASPVGPDSILKISNCSATNKSVSVACQGSYPGVCGADGDRLSCDDGINESHVTSGNNQIAAINISSYNTSVTNCGAIQSVFICYRRSVFTTLANGINLCNVSVDANNGVSPTQVNVTCPTTDVLQPLICNNVTSIESWNCSHFFGTSGTRAFARVQIAQSTGSGTRTLNVDALFFNVTYNVDNAPQINFSSPTETDGSYISNIDILVNFTAVDSNLKNLTINLYNVTKSLINSTNSTTSPLYANFSGLTDGIYYFNASACDTLNQCNYSSTRNVTIDSVNPNLNFTTQTEISGSYFTRNSIIVNASANDTNFKNVSIYFFDSTKTLINSSSSLINSLYLNFSGLSDGLYFFNASAYDLSGRRNITETRNVTIDRINPTINLTAPTETSGSYLSRSWILVNATSNDTNLKNISVSLFNSARTLVNFSNSSFSPLYYNFSGLTDGIYYFNASAYDHSGNKNHSEIRNITIDLINPNINFTSPTRANNTIISTKSFIVNLSSNDTNYANQTLYLYNSSNSIINTTFSTSTGILINFTNLTHGQYYYNATNYDLAGNKNNTETRWIFVNRTASLVSISASPNPISGGQTITITAVGANHTNNETLQFFCINNSAQNATLANTICTGGSTSSSFPYTLTCSFVVPVLGGDYNTFCRVFDGDVYSSTRNISYTVSSSVPVTSIISVAGDTTPSYIDTLNDGKTDILVSGNINISCRWATSDLSYASMTNTCSTPGGNSSRANCSINDVLSEGFFTRYVACTDNSTGLNGQNSSQNLDISFYLDYTAPTTSDNSVSSIQIPNYIVTITESDNVDTDPLTYYCSSSTAGCSPSTLIDNGQTITYTSVNRGVNYLRYYSVDFAGNTQSVVNKTININQLPVFTSAVDDAVTIKGGSSVNVSSVSYDFDSGQTITLRVCNSLGANSTSCTGTQYCTSTGTGNTSCTFNSEIDSASHSWYAYIFDSLNESSTGNPQTGSYTTDSTPPTITVIIPANTTYSSQNMTFEIITDSSARAAWFNLDSNSTANTTMTNVSATQWIYSATNLAWGSHNITFYANDSFGNTQNTSGIYFNISAPADVTAPVITILSPQNASFYSGSVLVNITTNEALGWAGYQLNGGSIISLAQTTTTNWNTTLTGLASEGTYNLTIYANDTSNNQANRTYLFYADSSAPRYSGAQASPSSVNVSTSVTCSVNWTDGFNITSVIISENSLGAYENHTISFSGINGTASYNIIASKLLNAGIYTCLFYATDSAGNINSTSANFTVIDNVIPEITIISPNNASYTPQTFMFMISTQENIQSAWFSLNGTTNQTMGNTTGKSWNYSIILGTGAYNIIFYANDSTGNFANSSKIYFNVASGITDTTPPFVISSTITNGSYYSLLTLDFNITANENISSARYKLNGGSLAYMSNTSMVDWNASLSLSEGSVNNITLYLNDSSNNQLIKNYTFYADSLVPNLGSGITASPNPVNETQSVICNVYINDSFGFSSVKISEDVTIPAVFLNHTISLSTSGWANYTINNVPKGNYRCIVYVADLAGNADSTYVDFLSIDVTSPILTINSPFNQTYNTNSIFLSLILNENASSAYYSLDGATNVSLSGSGISWSSTINTANGGHGIIFYANDTSGNLGNSSTLSFSIDTTIYDNVKPILTLWSPGNGTYYTSAEILINISSDKALSWAGYKLNSGSLTNLDNYSLTNWNITLTLSEGQYNLTIYANDTTSNKNHGNKSIVFYIDENSPQISSISCPDTNDSQNVTCTISFLDTIGLDYTIFSDNSTGVFQNSTQSFSGNTTATSKYIISAANTLPPKFNLTVYLFDKSGRTVQSSVNVNILDDKAPRIYNISYYPNTTDLLDPGVNVTINVTIFEDYAYGNVSVLYKLSTSSSWTYKEMINSTPKITNGYTDFNTSISLTNGTWQFKINATDAAGNQNLSEIYILIVAPDLSQNISSTISSVESITSAQISDSNLLGNILMNNTGDSSLDFSISVSSSTLGTRLNINGTENQTGTYSVSVGELVNLSIYVNSTGLSTGLYDYNVTITSAAGTTKLSYLFNIQSVAKPYLIARIDTYSSSVTKGQTGVQFIASVQNLGTQDATNVNFVWTLPSEFSLVSGNLSRSFTTIPIGSSSTNSITISVSSSSADKNVNITASASASNADSSSETKQVTIGSPAVQTVTNTVGIGGGGGGGGGAQTTSYSKIIEIVRGGEQQFEIIVYNKDYNKTMADVTLQLLGYLSQYMTFTPSKINSIPPRGTGKFLVTLRAPVYKENYEEDTIKAIINAYLGEGSSKTSYSETQNIKLIIQETSKNLTQVELNTAIAAIEEMRKTGFNIEALSKILVDAQNKLSQGRNQDAFDLAKEIIRIKDLAFQASNLINEVSFAIQNPSDTKIMTGNSIFNFIQSSNAQGMLDLANAAFDRGDYQTALDRAEKAKEILVMERKGNFILFLYLYWPYILFSFVVLFFGSVIAYRGYKKFSVKARIKYINHQEDNLLKLQRKLQQEYFSKKMSLEEYHRSMILNNKKLSNLRKTRIYLRNQRIKLLTPQKVLFDLESERKAVESDIKKLQREFYNYKTITEVEYKERFTTLNERVAEIEDERTTTEILRRKHASKA